MMRTGGGSLTAGDSPDSFTGLSWETWKVGWTFMAAGSLRWMAAAFTIRLNLEWPHEHRGQLPQLDLEPKILGGQPDLLSWAIHWGLSPAMVGLPLWMQGGTKERCTNRPTDSPAALKVRSNSWDCNLLLLVIK